MTHRTRTGLSPVLCRLHPALAALAICTLAAPRIQAQFAVRSWLPWRTIETRHFAFHYPVELEAWTKDVAVRADAIDSAVARVVGYAPARKTHVVVDRKSTRLNSSHNA